MNFNRKNPDNNSTVNLTPGFYGISERYHTLSVIDLFPRGTFISKENLEQKTETRMVALSYNNLKNHVKSKIGQQKKIPGNPLEMHPKERFTPHYKKPDVKIKKGSGIYRKILTRGGGGNRYR